MVFSFGAWVFPCSFTSLVVSPPLNLCKGESRTNAASSKLLSDCKSTATAKSSSSRQPGWLQCVGAWPHCHPHLCMPPQQSNAVQFAPARSRQPGASPIAPPTIYFASFLILGALKVTLQPRISEIRIYSAKIPAELDLSIHTF